MYHKVKFLLELIIIFKGADFDQKSLYSEYEITKKLGEGGFGLVMLGTHKTTGQKVAIKFVNSKAYGDASNISALFTEQESIKKIKHKNIITYFSTFMMKNFMVNIIEYCGGGELLDLIAEKGKLSEKEAKIIFLQIINAMNYCHTEFNLIHRDLKLENVLLKEKGKLDIKVTRILIFVF